MAEPGRRSTVILTLLGAGAVVGALAAAIVFSGAYDVAADAPHTGLVFSTLQTVRARSIANHAQGIAVPDDLGDAKRIAAGASEYAEMCSQCHLAPGMEKTEISQGLYPSAPEFARGDSLSAAEQFWAAKHGIKFTAMPAWGPTHEDALLWNIVAFIRKMPSLSAAQYKAMTAEASQEHEQMMHPHSESPDMMKPEHHH
jgi:mono/diheme cytochrome c family protein